MAQTNQVNLDMGDEDVEENPSRINRMDSLSRSPATNRSNVGLGDRLNSMFREIRPLVEHARMVSTKSIYNSMDTY